MKIFFEDKALEDLYYFGQTSDKKYKRLRINSLHYEKKAGDLEGQEFVRINDKYRLRLKSFAEEDGIVVNVILIEISKHYE